MKMTFQPKEALQSKSSWIPRKNEHKGRQKSISCQKIKRKKVLYQHKTAVMWSFLLCIEKFVQSLGRTRMKNSESPERKVEIFRRFIDREHQSQTVSGDVRTGKLPGKESSRYISKQEGGKQCGPPRITRLSQGSYRLNEPCFVRAWILW